MMGNKFVVAVGLVLLVLGCGQHSSTEEETVLFEINEPNYEATFATYDEQTSGSADGPRIMQRKGNLQSVLQNLFPGKQVQIKGEISNNSKYELEIRWQDSADADIAKQAIWSRIQQSLGFSTRLDTIKQTAYMLSISDRAKLQNNAGGEIPDGVAYKSKFEDSIWNEGNNWDVIATLPRMAQALSERINHPVNTNIEDNTKYQFELEISDDVSAIIVQLEDKYGLTLDANPQPLERIIVSAANN
jgi:hypothetical protein